MPKPLQETKNVLALDPSLSKFELLPIDSITADFHLNANTELAHRGRRELWREVVDLLRVDGLHKTYRTAGQAKPADGQLSAVGPNRLSDGETFTIPDGTTAVTFEIDKAGDGVAGSNVAVDVSSATSIDDVRTAVINAINGSALNINAQPARVLPPAAGGGGVGPLIDLFNTDTSHATYNDQLSQNTGITDTIDDEGFTYRGMEGARINSAIGEIYPSLPSVIAEGDTLTVPARGAAPQEIYEFDTDASVASGHLTCDLTGATTAVDVATAIAGAINTLGTDLTAIIAHVQATAWITALDPSKLVDGETFTLDDGSTATVFEFDKAGDGVESGRVAIDISAATSMQDVRAAIISAINGASLNISAGNPGFGSRIDLANSVNAPSADAGAISNTIAHEDFLTAPMEGFRARVVVVNDVAGTVGNVTLGTTVSDTSFEIVGMSGGVGAGWDVSGGRCILEGYNIQFDAISRLSPVVGAQNFLRVRVKERRLTKESDPSEVQISLTGIVGTLYGANLYRWTASIDIERYDADDPATVADEENVAMGELCEFDAVNGQTIVTGTEVPLRVTKFNRFLEPQDVASKVSKVGDTMSGQLAITISSGGDAGLVSTGGPTNGPGVQGIGQGTAAGVEGSAPNLGLKGAATAASGIGVQGESTGSAGIGVKGIGNSSDGFGVQAIGAGGVLVQRQDTAYPHLSLVADGDSGTPPTSIAAGGLWVPSTGTRRGLLHQSVDGGSWETVRAPTLGKVGNVEDAASNDKEVLRYNNSASQWERVSSLLQEVIYKSPKDAIISVINATLGDFALEPTRGEISVQATGTSSGASLEMSWVVPVPPGWESWGTGDVMVVPCNPSVGTIQGEIEVFDAVQATDHNPGPSAIGSTGWLELAVVAASLTGNYRNTSNNQGNMIIKALFNFGSAETITVGGLYIKSRNQNAFGTIPYTP